MRPPLFLPLFQDVVINLLAIIAHPQLDVVVERDPDLAIAQHLRFGLMELHNEGMPQSLPA